MVVSSTVALKKVCFCSSCSSFDLISYSRSLFGVWSFLVGIVEDWITLLHNPLWEIEWIVFHVKPECLALVFSANWAPNLVWMSPWLGRVMASRVDCIRDGKQLLISCISRIYSLILVQVECVSTANRFMLCCNYWLSFPNAVQYQDIEMLQGCLDFAPGKRLVDYGGCNYQTRTLSHYNFYICRSLKEFVMFVVNIIYVLNGFLVLSIVWLVSWPIL